MATFIIKGPFEVPVKSDKAGRIITKAQELEFWENNESIRNDVGCYIFAFRTSKALKPMYVGKATKSFKQEIFTDHKKNKYNEALAGQLKGTPIFFFVTLDKSPGPINKKSIDEVESFLIQSALEANNELLNIKKTAIEKWNIKGVIRCGVGKPSNAAQLFKKCLYLF